MQRTGTSGRSHALDHAHDLDALLDDGDSSVDAFGWGPGFSGQGAHPQGGADTPTVLFESSASPGITHVGGTTGGAASTTTTTTAASGFVINVSYDSSVANAPAGFTTVVGQVVQYFEAQFHDPVTLNIAVGYGEAYGLILQSGDLGTSYTSINSFSYATIVNALKGDATSSDDASAVASLPAIDPTGGHYWVTTAEAKALGLLTSTTNIDGHIGFSNSVGIFDYNNSDGVTAGQYDFAGIVAHEISEVMGRMMLVGSTVGANANSYLPLDLMHYSSPGVHDFSGSTPGYFSVDGGTTSLNTFNTNAAGDASDWAGATADPFNAFLSPGSPLPVSTVDVTALDAIGWDTVAAAPPPSSPPTLSDLTVGSLAVTTTGDLDFTVSNIGAGASTATTVEIDLSSNPSGPIASIALPALDPGGSASFVSPQLLLLLPAPGVAGTYSLSVVADPANHLVAESNESNNTASLPLMLAAATGSTLTGTAGNDIMVGSTGNDTLTGGAGADVLVGGGGDDHFVFKAKSDGLDQILDFNNTTQHDELDFSAGAFGKHLAVGNANTGTLDPSHFVAGTSAPSASFGTGFWYNTATETLAYVSNGKVANIAQIDVSGVNLHSTDIHLA